MLVTLQNCIKMLTFVVLFAYLCTRPEIKEERNKTFSFCFFGATFEQHFAGKLHASHSENINQIEDFHDTQKRYVAFPKQNTWILLSFDL